MATVEDLQRRWRWLPLRGCPGRFVLRGAPPTLAPCDLLGPDVALQSYRVSAAADEVVVAVLPDGGLLSYRHEDGSYTHTLNTPEGLLRKLAQLGCTPPAP